VQPDGASTRITYGVLNLTHRSSHEFPQAVPAGEAMEIELRLDDIAYRVQPGNRLRLSLSSAYWPLVWPSPETVTLTLHQGALDLPVRPSGTGDEWTFEAPEAASPRRVEELRKSSNSRTVTRDPASGVVQLAISDDFGEVRELDHGLVTGSSARELWTIDPQDPLSAHGETEWRQSLSRGDWSVTTETSTAMRSDRDFFYLEGRIRAWEGGELVFERDFDEKVPRGFL